ncbi:hypothetical protein BpHYR1_005646 [Brachionus plicatilis]|uniref:Chaoptin n=1 Tax=Brachionus plicatilis TaxID=10195 RepID=A0A3M7Q1L2_BRAPC|nr:hypothetical protein BpHYR1_005646 [Brachionus plicatilis]
MLPEKFFISFFDNVVQQIKNQFKKATKDLSCYCHSNIIIEQILLSSVEQLRDFDITNCSHGHYKFCYFLPNTKLMTRDRIHFFNTKNMDFKNNTIGNLIIIDQLIDEKIVSELIKCINKDCIFLKEKNFNSLENYLIACVLLTKIHRNLWMPVINISNVEQYSSISFEISCWKNLNSKSFDVIESFINCSSIQSLRLDLKYIDSTIKIPSLDVFSSLQSLNELKFYFSGYLTNGIFKQLENISSLVLQYVKGTESNVFDGLENLKNLEISYSQIKKLDPDLFLCTKELVELNLENNKIENISERCFTNLANLDKLILTKNKIRKICEHTLDGLGGLQNLDLSKNSIETIEPNALKQLNRLETLNLNSNKLKTIDQSTFIYQEKLKLLSLKNNNVTRFDFLLQLKNLQFLNLSENENIQSNLGLKSIFLPQLKMLVMQCQNVFVFDANLQHLQALEIHGIKHMEEGCFENLKNLDYLKLNFKKTNFLSKLNKMHFENVTGLKYFAIESHCCLFHLENVFSQMFYSFDATSSTTGIIYSKLHVTEINVEKSLRDYFSNHLKMFSEKFLLSFFDDVAKQITNHIKNVNKNIIYSNNIEQNLLSTVEQLRKIDLKKFPIGPYKFCFFIPNTTIITSQANQTLKWIQNQNKIGYLIIINQLIEKQIISELEKSLFDQNCYSLREDKFSSLENYLIACMLKTKIEYNHDSAVIDFAKLEKNRLLNLSINYWKNLNTRSLDIIEKFTNCSSINTFYLSIKSVNTIPCFDFYKSLSGLKELRLNFNGHLNNGTFKYLINLELLVLKYIKGIDDNVFNDLNNLKKLEVNYTKISQIYGDTFFPLKNLIELNLDNNQIGTVSDKCFSNLNNLKILNLSKNKIKKITEFFFDGLSKLKHLDLSENLLETLHPNCFGQLQRLELLNLRSNKLRKIDQVAVVNQEKLKFLTIQNNHVIKCDFLFQLRHLEFLDLSSAEPIQSSVCLKNTFLPKLKMLVLRCLNVCLVEKNFQNLQALEIRDIESLDQGCFRNLTNLEFLKLNFRKTNFLFSLGEKHFENLNGLKYFSVESHCSLVHLEHLFFDMFYSHDSIKSMTGTKNSYLNDSKQSLLKSSFEMAVFNYFNNYLVIEDTFVNQLWLNQLKYRCNTEHYFSLTNLF